MQLNYAAFLDKKHIIALVGAGGKTTVMYEMAEYFTGQGLKTLITTTTHIYQPAGYSTTINDVKRKWQQGSVAVIGRQAGENKLTFPDADLWRKAVSLADMVLVEADGAKGMPLKVPDEHEPVFLPEFDTVIGLVGMDALGKTLSQGCFRIAKAKQLLKADVDHIITTEDIAQILTAEQGTLKNVGTKTYYIILNKCDSEILKVKADEICSLLMQLGISADKIWQRGGVYGEQQ